MKRKWWSVDFNHYWPYGLRTFHQAMAMDRLRHWLRRSEGL